MAIIYTKKNAEQAPVQSIAQTAQPVQISVPTKAKKGQAKKLSVDGVRFDIPMRLRIGQMLTIFGVSAPQFHKMRKEGAIPNPSGNIGTGARPTPYWLTTHIAPYI